MNSKFVLTIYPDNPNYLADAKKLTSLLEISQLAGRALDKKCFATGDKFLSLLTFMGCSPNIELEPQDNKPFCYVELNAYSHPVFLSGKNTKYPPCPQCNTKLKSTKCVQCGNNIDPTKINWRKSAFTASCWITIGNIYELEAIPNDELLDLFAHETGIKWKYAYLRQVKAIKLVQ